MNLGFPTRFLKKLDIYQQIRNGQGISKYKKLWRYESAFLKTAYNKDHQHLGSFLNVNTFKEWVIKGDSSYNGNQYQEIISSLYWRNYIEAREKYSLLRNKSGDILVKDKVVMKGLSIPDPYEFRPTIEGLLVGEVIAEIKNDNCIIKAWNNYRYSLILDLIWLVIVVALIKLFLPENFLNDIQTFLQLNSIKNYFIAIFIAWPLFNWIYRSFYSALEK